MIPYLICGTDKKEGENPMADCGCGRSPTGKCVGWHDLSEEAYQAKKAEWEKRQAEKAAK